jgi:sugar lactone lactonase YvrE
LLFLLVNGVFALVVIPLFKPIYDLRKLILATVFALAILSGNKLFAQVPVITYTTPQLLVQNMAMTTSPSNTGGAVISPTAYSAATTLITTTISGPYGMATDAAGNVYVCDYNSGKVSKYTAGTGTAASFGTGVTMTTPTGIVFDAAGNCYVLNSVGLVYKFNAAGTYQSTITLTGVTTTWGIAIDAADNLYITSYNSTSAYQVVKYSTAGSTQTAFITGGSLNQPSSVAIDQSGNVLVMNLGGTGDVLKYNSAGVLQSTFATGYTGSYGMTIDRGGYVYIANYTASNVKVYNPTGGTALVTITTGTNPDGLTIDNKGVLYVANYTSGNVTKYTPKGGYFVDKRLPTGLVFNGPNGVISGTPTVAQAAITYSFIAYNATGASAVTTASLSVVVPPSISYSPSTQAYPLNHVISTYSATATGGAVGTFSAYGTATALTGGTLSSPWGMALDTAGNVYVANSATGTVSKYNANGTYSGVFATGLTNPVAIAFDATNTCYILGEATTSKVYKYNAAGTQLSANYIAGLNQSYGMAIDKSNNLYFTNITGTTYSVKMYNSAGVVQTSTITTSLLSQPTGITIDQSGNFFVLNGGATGNARIIKYPPTGGAGVRFTTATFGTSSYGIATDAMGNVYVGNATGGVISVYNAAGSATLATITGLTTPRSVAVDRYGNVYAASFTGNTLNRYSKNGGYFIDKLLPTGLAFNSTNGQITGTPTAASAMTTYTITAYNSGSPGGSSSTLINISTQLSDPNISYTTPVSYLAGLALGTGVNSPAPAATVAGSPVGSTLGYSNTPAQPLAGGTFTGPGRMGVDALGNIYVADFTGTTISKFTSDGVLITNSYGTGKPANFASPAGIVFDPAGNAYVLNGTSPAYIYKFNSSGVYQSTIALPSTVTAYGLAIDPTGDILYITNYSGTTGTSYAVYKYTVSTSTLNQTFISGATNLNQPIDIATDANGNVYVLNYSNYAVAGGTPGFISSFTSAGVLISKTVFTGFAGALSLKIDPINGYMYVADYNTPKIKVYIGAAGAFTTVTGAITITAPSGADCRGLIPDRRGNIYASDFLAKVIYKYAPTGLYFIDKALPGGLSISKTTGAISGTPTTAVSSPATDYTITAWNAGGGASTVLKMTIYQQRTWVGNSGVNSLWSTAANWSGGLPVPGDQVIFSSNYVTLPTISTPASIGSLTFGTPAGALGNQITVNAALTITGNITDQSDANSFRTTNPVIFVGTGSVTAANLYINANVAAGSNAYNLPVTTSLPNFNITGDVNIVSSKPSTFALNGLLNITAGSVVIGGALKTTSANGSTSSVVVTGGSLSVGGKIQTTNNSTGATLLSITGATLKLADPDPLSGLSSTGNTITLATGSTVEYSGSDQLVYSDSTLVGLPTGLSYKSIAFSGSGIKNVASGNLNIAGDFTNSLVSNNTDTYVDLSSSTINLTGTGQNLSGGTGAGTTLYTTNLTGGAKTMSGLFSLDSQSLLSMNGTSATILNAGAGVFTLNSDATGSATIGPLATSGGVVTGIITGTIYAQRFITGGGNLINRGYRLFSSPVSDAVATGFYNLSYLQNSGTFLSGTAGPGGGFDVAGTANMYLYRENVLPNATSFTAGNYRAITKINDVPSYKIGTIDGAFNLPVGNGLLFFFRGNNGTNAGTPPNDITLAAFGSVNQGQITVKNWYNSGIDTLGYTSVSGSINVQGFNLVGNPYPSSIDWNKLYGNNTTTTGICCAANLSNSIYIYNATTKNYSVYTSTSSSTGFPTGSPGGSNIIPQGQGFFVQVTRLTGPGKLIFNETAKVTNQPATLLLNATTAPIDQHLRIQLAKDAVNKDETVILFNKDAGTAYTQQKDALYLKGSGQVSLSSISSDKQSLAFYQLPLPKKIQIIPLNIGVNASGTYQLNTTEVTNIPDMFDIWLMDNYQKDSLDIKHNKTYTFNATTDTASYGANRFKVVIKLNSSNAVHLLSFAATKGTSTVKLTWTAENEANYTTYVLQRSIDGGKTFTILDSFRSVGLGTYDDLDPHPAMGINQYRLKQVDIIGNVTYSNIVSVTYAAPVTAAPAVDAVSIYPNPVRYVLGLVIKPANSKPANYKITITNNMGIVVKTATTSLSLWLNDVVGLLPGTYFASVVNTNDNSLIGRATFIKL